MKQNYDMQKFIAVHRSDYQMALSEIRCGRKRNHWMWYIFPQVRGLGYSSVSQYYGIKNLDEAITFLEDEYLGKNLKEIGQALLKLETNNATKVFGSPDDMKLKSSMTLFALASGKHSVFHEVLDKYFEGEYDKRTLEILGVDEFLQ